MNKTYCGWTKEEIYEAENSGDYYIPTEVLIAFENDDYDGSDEWSE
ncbi:hypothetical protein [Colwellia ponticola]|nr:hypothetical protein [Colwellia ponticola]